MGHRLHAAGDDDLELAGADELVGQRDGVEAGQADLVDRQRGDVHRDAALDGGLARRDLARAGLDDVAHDHVVDLVGRDAGALERGLDGDPAEVRGGEVLERAEQPAHRGAGSSDDDGRTGAHGDPPATRVRGQRHDTAGELPHPRRGPRARRHRHRPRRLRRARPRRSHRLLRPHLRPAARAPRGQRGAGRRGGDGRDRRLRRSSCSPRCAPTRPSAGSSSATARASSRSRSASPTSTSPPSACATPACACSTTRRAAAPRAHGSTSCTPRTAAASSSSWSSLRHAADRAHWSRRPEPGSTLRPVTSGC